LPYKEIDRFWIDVSGSFQFDGSMLDRHCREGIIRHAISARKINDESEKRIFTGLMGSLEAAHQV